MSHSPETPRLELEAPARSMRYLPAIDGLRAVAVISVVIYHLNGWLLPGGFLGVDLFFVISGFVVSGAIPTSGLTGIGRLLAFFYARRAVRILPALYVCLLGTSLLSLLFIPPSWLSGINEKTGRAAVLGYSNFVLANSDGNYFAPRAEYNMFTHTWSLGVEEQFYAVFPWLFLAWVSNKRTLSMAFFLTGAAVSFLLASHGAETNRVAAFYLIFSRFWELALGVLAFQLSSRIVLPAGEHARGLAAAACMAVLAFAFITAAPSRTPFPASLAPCAAAALMLVLIRQGGTGGLLHCLSLRPVVEVGRLSYSLYLWHWPIFVLFRWTVGLDTWKTNSSALGLAVAAAMASYRFVETPPRRAVARGAVTSRTALATAAILVALVHQSEKSIWGLTSSISLSSVARDPKDWYPDADLKITSASGCQVIHQLVSELAVSAIRFNRLMCTHAAASPPNLFILGDSHAGAYVVLLANYVLTTGAAGTVYYEGGCAVLGQKQNDQQRCDRFIEKSVADVELHMKPGDIIFLPGLRVPRIVDEDTFFGEKVAREIMFGHAHREWREQDLQATIPLLSRLATKGVQIVLEAPKPEFAAPLFRCHDWFNAANPICAGGFTIARASIEALRAPVMAQFRAAANAVPGLRIWDPLPLLCPGEICSAYDGAMPLFFDGDHLSGYANRKLAPAFQAFVLHPPP